MKHGTSVFSVIGFSGSGKTTLIEHLIRHFGKRGRKVAAIKHTHHLLGTRQGGDTARFAGAGALEVILAGDGSAVLWRGAEVTSFDFARPEELLEKVNADVVLIEGFKPAPLGQAILIEPRQATERLSPRPANVVFVIGDVANEAELRELTEFLGRITSE